MGRKKKTVEDEKTKRILSSIMIDTDLNQYEVQEDIGRIIKEYKESLNLDTYNITLGVKDTAVIEWQQGSHFTKVFIDEIKYINQIYGLSKGERNLLNSLPPFLLWEKNLLANDETKIAVNQGELAELLDIDRTTIYRNMKGLMAKKIICEYSEGKEKFYFVNPYVMYAGRKINKGLVNLFKLIGYIDRIGYENTEK